MSDSRDDIARVYGRDIAFKIIMDVDIAGMFRTREREAAVREINAIPQRPVGVGVGVDVSITSSVGEPITPRSVELMEYVLVATWEGKPAAPIVATSVVADAPATWPDGFLAWTCRRKCPRR